MIQNYIAYRILELFFDNPRKRFYQREVSRIVKLAQLSTANHLKSLIQMGYITFYKDGLYPTYGANRDSAYFKLLKVQNLVLRLKQSGCIDFISQKTQPDCIILFGSCSRGEDTEESDIDIFVQCEEFSMDLEKFQKVLKRKIHLFFEPSLKSLDSEIKNNIINGQILQGYLKVF